LSRFAPYPHGCLLGRRAQLESEIERASSPSLKATILLNLFGIGPCLGAGSRPKSGPWHAPPKSAQLTAYAGLGPSARHAATLKRGPSATIG
jgi:hypothetical protein